MLISRSFSGLLVATALTVAAEARASSCSDPAACLCPFVSGLNTTFAGTIQQASGGTDEIEVRLDSITLAGKSTTLTVGSVIPLVVRGTEGAVSNGARVVGFSVNRCENDGQDCNPLTMIERATLQRIAASATTFECNGTTLSVSAESIAATMASAGCSSEVARLLQDAGADPGCGACATRPGPASSCGWIAFLAISAMIGRRRLRS